MPPKKVDPKAAPVEEKKEHKNPQIKLEPEAVFHKRAEPVLATVKGEIEEGKSYFNEAQTKKFFEGALDRDLLAEVWET